MITATITAAPATAVRCVCVFLALLGPQQHGGTSAPMWDCAALYGRARTAVVGARIAHPKSAKEFSRTLVNFSHHHLQPPPSCHTVTTCVPQTYVPQPQMMVVQQPVAVPVVRQQRPRWQPDSEAAHCTLEHCKAQFNWTNSRHHCRKCGFVVCGRCSTVRRRRSAVASLTRIAGVSQVA